MQIKSISGVLGDVGNNNNYLCHHQPVRNRFPDVLVFKKADVVPIQHSGLELSEVRLSDTDCVVKTVRRAREHSFLKELATLKSMPSHPNVVRFIGVVDAGYGDGTIDGIVAAFIPGRQLKDVKSASEAQKAKWKQEIQTVVEVLHAQGLLWGDVKAAHIIIEQTTDRPALIDFGGGYTPGWIGKELADSAEDDLQGLERLFSFIDELE